VRRYSPQASSTPEAMHLPSSVRHTETALMPPPSTNKKLERQRAHTAVYTMVHHDSNGVQAPVCRQPHVPFGTTFTAVYR
jgi:hypothetical protein